MPMPTNMTTMEMILPPAVFGVTVRGLCRWSLLCIWPRALGALGSVRISALGLAPDEPGKPLWGAAVKRDERQEMVNAISIRIEIG